MIIAAADGSSLGNPGPTGWAWYVDSQHWQADGIAKGTNNIGELTAVQELLRSYQGADDDLHILCDSQYVINCITKWIHNWKRKNWRKSDGKPVLNADLIREIDGLMQSYRDAGRKVTFEWVKGHAGHVMNEKADDYARAAATAIGARKPVSQGPGSGYRASAATDNAASTSVASHVDAGDGCQQGELFPTMEGMTDSQNTQPTSQSTSQSTEPVSTARSATLFQRAQKVTPGGVNSPVRAFGSVGGTPLFIDRAKGSHLYDVDGNEYVDLVCSWGPMLHGNAHPQILDAVQRAATKGLSFGTPTENEITLAEEIISRTAVESVRLVNSGTEATMSAVRLARGFTGRPAVLKFAGCYHGHVDSLLVSAGSGVATYAVPDSPGVTSSDTIVVEYNNLDAVREAFAAHPDRIACIITEAAAGNMGTVAPDEGFNAALKQIAHDNGALLITDEVMTGFRTSRQGWYGVDGVAGDLVTFGKVVSGGLPAAAFGGRADIMAYLAPQGPVYQAGTLSGNPVATAAGLASLRLADDACYETINRNADRLAGLLTSALSEAGVAHHIQRAATFLSVRFAEGEGRNFADMQAADTFRYPAFFHTLLDHGIYTAPSVFETWFVSTALTDDDFERIEKALRPAAQAAAAAQPES